MPPAVRAVCRIKGGEFLLFPVPADQFPVPTKTFPVLVCREFVCNTLKLIHDLILKIAKRVEKITNSLLFSLFSGNSREKNWETI